MSIEDLKRENAELKATNLELKNQINLMQTIFDSLSEGVVATNLEGEFLLVNSTTQDITGAEPTEGSPKEWDKTYGTFYADTVTVVPSTELPLYKAMQGKTTDDVKLFMRNANKPAGVFIGVSGRPLFDESNDLIGGVIVIRDISELEKVTQQLETTVNELQNRNALMDTVFNSIGDGVIVADKEGQFLFFNPTAQEIVGVGPTTEKLENWSETHGRFHPDKVTPIPSDELPLSKAIRGEVTNDVEIFIRNQNRPEGFLISVSGRPLYDETDNLVGGVVVFRDVTQLNLVKRELETAVNELQNQNALMDTVFNSIGDGVIVADKEGQFLFFNPTAQEIVGIGPTEEDLEKWSETYGTFYPDRVTPIPSTELPLSKAIQGEVTDGIEIFIRNQNRPEGVLISVSGRPLYDETDNLVGGVVVFHDVTQLNLVKRELETTVNKLQTQNALMDAIFNSISDGLVVSDKDGKYVMVNDTAKAMGGQVPDIVHSTQASETFGLFQPDSETPFPSDEMPIVRALRGEDPDNVQMFVRNLQVPHGVDISVSARPIYGEKDLVNGAVSIIRDVSERKASEKQLIAINDQLTAQSQLMESIFNSISDGVIVADGAGHIIMFNPSAERIVGLVAGSSTNMIRREQWLREYKFFQPDGVTPWPLDNLPLIQALRGESIDNVEMFLKHDRISDGLYLSVSGRPLQHSDGKKAGGVLVFHDMTDRIKSQEAVAQAFVQGRLEIVDTILHNIGNAINSVTVGIDTVYNLLADDLLVSRLTALAEALKQHENNLGDYIENHPQGQKVLPFLLTIAEDFKDADEKLRQTVERIQNRTRHIVDIIRTQNSYQNTSGIHKDINLAEAISDAVKILQDSINKRQIQIVIDCDNALPEIRTQESQFHQMLVNLIKNSIEAIDELANLGKLYEEPRIKVHGYIDDDFLCLDITDNGIGLAPETVDKIFSAGFTTKEQGSGLGLHSSANFVVSSGGHIQAFSDGKGKGTTLRIRLRNSLNSAG